MYNLNIGFLKTIKDNTLQKLRLSTRRMNFIFAAAKPFRMMHAEFIVFAKYHARKIGFTSQVNDMEQILNEKFDPIAQGIYIDNYNSDPLYIHTDLEAQPPLYIYNEWNPATNYVVGEYAQLGFNVYRCLINNINAQPDSNPFQWVLDSEGQTLNVDSNFSGTYSFIVYFPASAVFDLNEMIAVVSANKLAGTSFIIQSY